MPPSNTGVLNKDGTGLAQKESRGTTSEKRSIHYSIAALFTEGRVLHHAQFPAAVRALVVRASTSSPRIKNHERSRAARSAAKNKTGSNAAGSDEMRERTRRMLGGEADDYRNPSLDENAPSWRRVRLAHRR